MSALATVAPLVVGSVAAAGWAMSAHAAWRLRCQLRTDRLTGLPNRDALLDRFARATRRGRGRAVGVLLLDLDGFKQVNDTYGHAAGNAVLQHVADRLTEVAEARGELPVRLHGDEFAVLLTGLPAMETPLDIARQRAAQVERAICTPLGWAGVELVPAVSVGAAVAPAEHADLSVLLHAADQRMYAQKTAAGATDSDASDPGPSRDTTGIRNAQRRRSTTSRALADRTEVLCINARMA